MGRLIGIHEYVYLRYFYVARGNLITLHGPAGRGCPHFLQSASGRGLGPAFFGLVKALRSALASAVSRLRWFRLFVFSLAFGVGFGRLAVAAVSCMWLVVRGRQAANAFQN